MALPSFRRRDNEAFQASALGDDARHIGMGGIAAGITEPARTVFLFGVSGNPLLEATAYILSKRAGSLQMHCANAEFFSGGNAERVPCDSGSNLSNFAQL
jgi:hypothetical protein